MGIALLAGLAALAVGCSGGDDGGADEAAEEPPPTTTTSTTVPPTTTTTTSPFYDGPEYVDGMVGEGCTPGDVDQLPEGWWAGSIRAVDGLAVDFDVMCYLDGQAGIDAAWEDTGEPEIYHLRNPDPRAYRVTFPSADLPATCSGEAEPDFACTIGDILPLYPGVDRTGMVGDIEATGYEHVWIHITGTTPDYLAVIYDMVEDYIPPSDRPTG